MVISSLSGKQVHLAVEGLDVLSTRERLINGIKRGGLFLVVAALCILLPVVHFFLVPLFLLLTPVMAYLETQKTHRNPQLNFKCVDCQTALSISRGYNSFPLTMNCYQCGARLHLDT
jgi:hypothetical protein